MIKEITWIIGASSGIGKALALEMAQDPQITLILSARDEAKLEEVASACGNRHEVMPLDIINSKSIEKSIQQLVTQYETIDRVIILPAVYNPGCIMDMTKTHIRNTMEVNIIGVMDVVQKLLPVMTKQPSGQIALCASIAGVMGLPQGQPYSASKAALINFAESLYAEAPNHIDIKLINPGFVKTPMTDKNTFTMPMIISPEEAAKAIKKGLFRKGFEIHFPKKFTLWLKLLAALPYGLSLAATQYIKQK